MSQLLQDAIQKGSPSPQLLIHGPKTLTPASLDKLRSKGFINVSIENLYRQKAGLKRCIKEFGGYLSHSALHLLHLLIEIVVFIITGAFISLALALGDML